MGGRLIRTNPPGIANAGVALRELDVDALALLQGTIHFQCIYRDPAAGMTGFNLSNTLSIALLP
ncbi:MAG: hypothetical protein ACI841_004818 [Planctomycetota bacterium]